MASGYYESTTELKYDIRSSEISSKTLYTSIFVLFKVAIVKSCTGIRLPSIPKYPSIFLKLSGTILFSLWIGMYSAILEKHERSMLCA